MKKEKDFLDYFWEISSIPRGSGHNEKISDYLVDFAKEQGFYVYQDEAKNVLIRKDATPGYEEHPGIILQGHMDMVCVKESDSPHDFLTQGLELMEDEDFIWANGTSLGADDGIAIAYGLAILASSRYAHPQLELLVTTDEEVGMLGAAAFDASQLKGRWLLNLDSEEEEMMITGCAGGLSCLVRLPVKRKKAEDEACCQLRVKGLLGGHSGTEIHKKRQNANIVLGRILAHLKEKTAFSLYDVRGGEKDNVIPSEAAAVISFPQGSEGETLLEEIKNEIQEELYPGEPGIRVEILKHVHWDQEKNPPLEEESLKRALSYLILAPNGVQAMSPSVEGMVESSLNLGIVKLLEEELSFTHAVRSSVPSYKKRMGQQLNMLADLLGGTYEESGSYPEWRYKEVSPFRNLAMEAYERVFGKPAKQMLIHAGLECGILAEKKPELEIISLGPDTYDIHSSREKLSKASAKRVFHYVTEVLKSSKPE